MSVCIDKIQHVEALNVEIAGRRLAEASLELTNAVLTAARESSLDGILVVDPQGRIISYNQRFLELFHIPVELAKAGVDEPLLRHVTASMKDPAAFLARVADLYKHREESGADRLELANGRIINRYTTPLSRGERGYLGRIWFFRDVTEQEAIELAVRRSEEKYRNLVEATTDYIWESDKNGHYTYVSPAARIMLGYEPEEIVGKTLFDFMSVAEAARVRRNSVQSLQPGRCFRSLRTPCCAKTAPQMVIETSGVPIFDQNGVFIGYRGIDRDISARKEAEAATEYRGALLHAVSVVAKELLTAPEIEIAMATVLKTLGEAARVDRVLVFEAQTSSRGVDSLSLRYAWHSPRAPVIVNAASTATMAPDTFGPIGEGQAHSVFAKDMPDGAVKSLFLKLGTRANLVVPVAVDGKVWGRIAFDDCTTARAWSAAEIDILGIVADMIGGAIIRERYVEELKNANTIVESSPTILFRLRGDPSLSLIYVSHNVSLYGYDPAGMLASPVFWRRRLQRPPGRTRRRRATAAAGGDRQTSRRQFRIHRPAASLGR